MRAYVLLGAVALAGSVFAVMFVPSSARDDIHADRERMLADPAEVRRAPGVGAPRAHEAQPLTFPQAPPPRAASRSTPLLDEVAPYTSSAGEAVVPSGVELIDPWTDERHRLRERPRAQLDRANPWTGRNDL